MRLASGFSGGRSAGLPEGGVLSCPVITDLAMYRGGGDGRERGKRVPAKYEPASEQLAALYVSDTRHNVQPITTSANTPSRDLSGG
jgi:hypothetical protein